MANWNRRRLGAVDLDTGEIFEEGIPVYFKAKVRWKEDFFMGIQEAFEVLAKDKDIRPDTSRVFHYMLSKLSWENFIHVQQAEMARELDMHPSQVSRAVKQLVEKRIVIIGPKVGRSPSYKLNSRYGFKGKLHKLDDYRQVESKHLRVIEGGRDPDTPDMFGEGDGAPA